MWRTSNSRFVNWIICWLTCHVMVQCDAPYPQCYRNVWAELSHAQFSYRQQRNLWHHLQLLIYLTYLSKDSSCVCLLPLANSPQPLKPQKLQRTKFVVMSECSLYTCGGVAGVFLLLQNSSSGLRRFKELDRLLLLHFLLTCCVNELLI